MRHHQTTRHFDAYPGLLSNNTCFPDTLRNFLRYLLEIRKYPHPLPLFLRNPLLIRRWPPSHPEVKPGHSCSPEVQAKTLLFHVKTLLFRVSFFSAFLSMDSAAGRENGMLHFYPIRLLFAHIDYTISDFCDTALRMDSSFLSISVNRRQPQNLIQILQLPSSLLFFSYTRFLCIGSGDVLITVFHGRFLR